MLGIFDLSEPVTDVCDLDPAVRHLGVGIFAAMGMGGILLFENGSPVSTGLLAVAGGWILLDAVQRLRHEGLYVEDEDPEPSDGREAYQSYVTEKVHRKLRDSPRTRRALSDELEADDATIDRALERLDDRDLLRRDGDELRVPAPPEEGRLERVIDAIAGGLRRVARPLVVEFR